MFGSSKLKRLRDREERKAEKERNLLNLKQFPLPVFELSRQQQIKCRRCSPHTQDYETTYEEHLNPIDVLKDDRKSIFEYFDRAKKILSCVMRGLVVEPIQIKMLQFLQEQKSDVPLIFVMKSNNLELDYCIIQFILKKFDVKIPTQGNKLREALASGHNVIISDDSQFQEVFEITQSKSILWLPISIAYEVRNSALFKFTLYDILRKTACGYGLVKVTFHQPYKSEDFSMRNANFIRDHLYHDIILKAPVMSTDLTAFLLLTYFSKGGKIEEICEKLHEIRKKKSCSMDFAFEGENFDIIEHSLEILGEYITINKEGIIAPKGDKIGEFKDYARVLLHHFAFESAILSTAMHLKEIDPFVDYNKLMKCAENFFNQLIDKIPSKGCVDIYSLLIDAFENLSHSDVLKRHEIQYTEKERRAQKMAKYHQYDFDDDDYKGSYDDELETEEEELDPNNKVIINIDSEKEINFAENVVLLIQGVDNLV